MSTHPGAIFSPSPVASNALGTSSFNRVLLSAARGRIERCLKFPVSWLYGVNIARGCILALDNGISGERSTRRGLRSSSFVRTMTRALS